MITPMNETPGTALLRLLPARPEAGSEKLPVLTTAADIRELIQYLKRRPAGVNAAEELDRPKKRLFEDRKLDAYEFLGITTCDDQTLRLTSLGWKFARRMESDAEVFRHLLSRQLPYVMALDWISQQKIDMVTSTELRDFWHGAHSESFAFDDQEAIRGSVVSFFSICQAASLGTMTLGKRGHITRFFVDRDELAKFLTEGSAPPFTVEAEADKGELIAGAAGVNETSVANYLQALTALIQCKNPRVVELIQRTLEIANVPSLPVDVVWDRNGSAEGTARSPGRELCALIVVLGEDSFIEDRVGNFVIRDSVLLELGAALVLYDRRVIVLADKRYAACEGISELISYEFDGERMDWEVGINLINQVAAFREKCRIASGSDRVLRSAMK